MGKAMVTKDDRAGLGDNLNRLLQLASKGDEEAMAKLRQILEDMPAVWEGIGDIAAQARHSLVKVIAGNNKVTDEAIERKLKAMRAELAGPSPFPLEKLLVERITLCWLQLSYADTIYTQNMSDLSIRQADYHQRRITHCHKRYLSAIKALAMVRRLLRPVVAQVNIAEQQVNVCGAKSTAPVTFRP